MSQYVFDNAASQTAQRFTGLAALHDPTTVRHLEALGVGEGWICWEVGAGGGSIAAWLARHVGERGQVLVTDIDPRYLAALEAAGLANTQVQHHDVTQDPLPVERFDLIHARLVLLHLPTADQVLRQLVEALKPGGRLLIEDYDLRLVDRAFPIVDPGTAAVFQRGMAALAQVIEGHGRPPGWGRGLYQRLRAEGLVEVGMEGQLAVCLGGSEATRMIQVSVEQVQEEALQRGLLTKREIEEVLTLLEDPTVAVSSAVMCSAWGRRPPS
jgi:ubiquinone/menaquinone biosynthesis C-methylase UbiE